MNNKSKIKINQDFFKTWSPEMAYVLGFAVADGCIIKRNNGLDSYVVNETPPISLLFPTNGSWINKTANISFDWSSVFNAQSYVFNLTSKDKELLQGIKEALGSDYKIGTKYNSLKMPYSQIQICNSIICKDLIKLGIHPKKNL